MKIFFSDRLSGLRRLRKAAGVKLDSSKIQVEENDSSNSFLLTMIFTLIVVISISYLIFYYANNIIDQRREERNKALQIWKANGCPVYKSECGGKHKYACEIKANAVGKVDIGYAIVEAYPTCPIEQSN